MGASAVLIAGNLARGMGCVFPGLARGGAHREVVAAVREPAVVVLRLANQVRSHGGEQSIPWLADRVVYFSAFGYEYSARYMVSAVASSVA